MLEGIQNLNRPNLLLFYLSLAVILNCTPSGSDRITRDYAWIQIRQMSELDYCILVAYWHVYGRYRSRTLCPSVRRYLLNVSEMPIT